MCSGFSLRAFFCLRRCLIQLESSATESHPTESLMRLSDITRLGSSDSVTVQIDHRAARSDEGAEPITLGADREPLRAGSKVPSTGGSVDAAQHCHGLFRAPADRRVKLVGRACRQALDDAVDAQGRDLALAARVDLDPQHLAIEDHRRRSNHLLARKERTFAPQCRRRRDQPERRHDDTARINHDAAAMTSTVAPSATCLPTPASTSVTTPSTGATRACSIFIASRTARRCPLRTAAPFSTSSASNLPCIGAVTAPPSAPCVS